MSPHDAFMWYWAIGLAWAIINTYRPSKLAKFLEGRESFDDFANFVGFPLALLAAVLIALCLGLVWPFSLVRKLMRGEKL